MSRVLIVGCGYAGSAIAHQLRARGDTVTGWVRSEETAAPLRAEGFSMITGNVSLAESWRNVPRHFDAVIHCASSGRGGAEAYASVYREGLRQILAHQPKASIVFTSSTSVYAQTDGGIVTEESPTEPQMETGKILRETEQLGMERGAVIVRLAGLYGPGRGALIARLKRGEAVIEGDGLRWINQIHRDDAASAVIHALDRGVPGALYNASDGDPVSYLDFYKWACVQLHQPLPPFGPINADRKRGVTNKRVSNAKLLAAGWQPLFPDFRAGYASCLDRIPATGAA